MTALHDPVEAVTLKDQKAVDTTLADELNKLSVREREMIYEEIHGVERTIPETPSFVDTRLDLLDLELRRIPVKPAYDLAESKSKDFVSSPKLRLMFLRADNFDAQKAAQRMVKYFEGKLRTFGETPLARPVMLSDLNDDDRAALASGCYSILPTRDRSGRAVFLDLQNMIPKTWKRGLNLIRAATYVVMSALEDEETQRRGMVCLMYHMGDDVAESDADLIEGFSAMRHLPFKLGCLHMCFGNPWVSAYARTLLGMSGRSFRARARLHSGSHTELQYNLMTFGLPMDVFPVSTEGEVKNGMEKWIAKRQRKEQSLFNNVLQDFNRVDVPGRWDVLVGKGKPFQRHVGNVRLRAMVESYIDEYISAPKGEKHLVPRKVLTVVRQDGGRFLKKEKDGWWVEVSCADALDKVSKLFLSTKAGSKGTNRNLAMFKALAKEMARRELG
eukprot:CAMPEP_0117054296 /NCGR_PEP_ID=MMETSP0472-20121206/37631_1 /TAXON_ID=693140 ORGANISM="Tiarina fusus, Strain LIS" /NCGR_SAMPLE_ID=MMETSP0472 /ASSEMBLY_ACC=CAM_ASM_000603 /LENGTH=443 /DNA_ID=CAMNT_0004769833 /DNA_START=135 /DNA_END=1467 /DNA_ORIENTATION=-